MSKPVRHSLMTQHFMGSAVLEEAMPTFSPVCKSIRDYWYGSL